MASPVSCLGTLTENAIAQRRRATTMSSMAEIVGTGSDEEAMDGGSAVAYDRTVWIGSYSLRCVSIATTRLVAIWPVRKRLTSCVVARP